MNEHQQKLFRDILDRWHVPDDKGLSIQQAAMDIGILSGIIMSLDTGEVYVKKMRSKKPTDLQPTMCRRAGEPSDEPHHRIGGVCAYCGDGQKPPPPEAYEKPVTENRIETIPCAEHGFHSLTVRPDGSYDKPDCAMFKYDREAP